MKLIYRMSTKDDEEALVKLWCEHGGWDQIDTETWSNRFMKSPSGPASIVLAIDQENDEIVGQFAFIPSLVSINGREVSALRPFAPIVAKHTRNKITGFTPVISMYRFAVQALKARGDGLIYMMPDPRWLKLFQVMPSLQCTTFPLWSLELPLKDSLPLDSSYTVAPIKSWSIPIDHLWEKASQIHPCLVVRNTRALSWKIGGGDYDVIGIQRNDELIGLVASKQKGDRQWLICDLLTVDAKESLQATLTAVTNLANEKSLNADPDSPIRKVAILATPIMEPILKTIGFSRESYKFPIVVEVLDPTLAKEDVHPSRWYLSAND